MDYEYKNGPSSGTFPSSQEEVEAGVLAAYKYAYTLVMGGTPFRGMLDCMSDIDVPRHSTTALTNGVTSNLSPSASQMESVYKYIYKTAGRVYLVLDNLDGLRGTKLTEEEYLSYKAELLLIRDYVYELGAELYGDMIFNDHSLSLDDYEYPRSPYMDNVHRMLDELPDELLDALPIRFDQSKYGDGRIGRVAAYGLKARLALHWAHEDPSLYAEAARCAAKALELAQGTFSLEPFDVTYCGADHTEGEPSVSNLFGFVGHNSGTEWLWGSQYGIAIEATHQGSYFNAPRTLGGACYYGPSQGFVDAIQCSDGLPITESPLYDWSHPWKNRDPRLDLFIVRPGSRLLGVEFETAKKYTTVHDYVANTEIANLDITSSSKGEYSPNGAKGLAGYTWRKYMDNDEFTSFGRYFGNTQFELPYPLMRLAEIYLIEAEANIEMDGGSLSKAADDIDMIRARAHMPALTAKSKASKAGMRKALRYERMVELCHEGFRWFDIRRWKDEDGIAIANTVLNDPIYGTNNTENDGPVSNAIPTIDDNWHCSYDANRTWDGKTFNLRVYIQTKYVPEKDIHWPIPESELNANSLVTQNPNY
jgi:hypothetical protein